MKKRLADVCPQKEKCKKLRRCRPCCEAVGFDVADAIERLIGDGLDFRVCKLYGWKKKDVNVYENSYPILGEYLSKEKKVVLYVKNIDVACKDWPTYNGVLPTYIHELFHAFFHYVTEQKHAGYNSVREIEESMVEFSTLVFLGFMKKEHAYEWCDIFDWAYNEIGKKQKAVGDLPAYGFGRYLFDSIPENEAFDWINKYSERLGYIDEEDELVKQYKQMVYPCYPAEPEKCKKLLKKILFETSNKPVMTLPCRGNRNRIKLPADFINEWDSIIQKWMSNPNVLSQFVGKSKDLSINHLPEPYYGDMTNCSIVMINLNPGVGMDYQDWHNKDVPGTDVNRAKVNKYSGYAMPFPLLSGNTPSSNWWKSRNAWMNRILRSKGIETDKKPFAIELCPLHSKKFKITNPTKYVKGISNPKIDVIEVIKYAITFSDAKIGLAVGKSIYRLLMDNGFCETSSYYHVLDSCREYHIVENDGVRVLCTWAQGSNSAPADRFSGFEKSII